MAVIELFHPLICLHKIQLMCNNGLTRLTVVSCEAKEDAANGVPTYSRLIRVSILLEQEL